MYVIIWMIILASIIRCSSELYMKPMIYSKNYFCCELICKNDICPDYTVLKPRGWVFYNQYNDNEIPFHNKYMIWDTNYVDPYGFNLNNIKEPIYLDLVNTKHSHFNIPACGNIYRNFGLDRSHYNFGIKIRKKVGDSVSCAFDGIVRVSKICHEHAGVVVVRHYNGLETIYAYLDNIILHPNSKIKAGEFIGTVTKIGLNKDTYFHFETRYLGYPINPADFIDFERKILKSNTLIINDSTFAYINEIERELRILKAKIDKCRRASFKQKKQMECYKYH